MQKAIISGEEYGWKRTDVKEVINKSVEIGLGIIGGEVQFKLTDGTYELYWQSYDTEEKGLEENWTNYCQRTKKEALTLFEKLPSDKELVKEAFAYFDSLKEKYKSETELYDSLIFIIYFKTPV